MPLYEYRCTKCGHRLEKIQSFGSEPLTECPKCHGTLERPLTAPALQFKGAGWYVNDYAGKAKSSSDSSAAEPSSGSTAADKPQATASSDSKPAASESKPAASQPASGGSSGTSSSGASAPSKSA